METKDLLGELPDYDAADFTVYARTSDCPSCTVGDHRAQLKGSGQDVRVIVCKCFGGEWLSLSVRRLGKAATSPTLPLPKPMRLGDSAFACNGEASEKFLNSIGDLCKVVIASAFRTELGAPLTRQRGLIVIAGSTNAGKSQIARGLIHKYLSDLSLLPGRRPHLVTFEDPIEVHFCNVPTPMTGYFAYLPSIDYTPRQPDEDASTLKEVQKEALRQTPTVFYVGETRDPEDLKDLIAFANTGHLVLTTFHAGSLTESVSKLLQAVKARTPADRSYVVRTLFAVVHLASDSYNGVQYTIPAVWRATAAGQMALTGQGLASILPIRGNSQGAIGRTQHAQLLIDLRTKSGGDLKEPHKALEQEVLKRATQWDLEGV